jgi:hypothetical protein
MTGTCETCRLWEVSLDAPGWGYCGHGETIGHSPSYFGCIFHEERERTPEERFVEWLEERRSHSIESRRHDNITSAGEYWRGKVVAQHEALTKFKELFGAEATDDGNVRDV